MAYKLTNKSSRAIRARYNAACKAIGKEDPSLTITDSHADIDTLLTQRSELLAALKGVVRVADRATVEFDAARAAIAKAEAA